MTKRTLFVSLMMVGAIGLSLSGSLPVPTATASSDGGACWDLSCYRTYDAIQTLLQTTASAYPQLVSLQTIGTSWEGTRALRVVRLGNAAAPAQRPAIYLVAEQHPKDITTPEMLLRYMAYLTTAYGSDPEATWLMDNRWIYLLPLANPDGYFRVYNDAQCSRIKNTDNANGCSSYLNSGTDLNRNFPFQWNTGGASSQPCDSSYPGPSPLSEPESSALLASITSASPGLVLQLSAPAAGAGQSIRYPWGYSSLPAPDAAGLDALAWGMGARNGTQRGAVTQHNHGAGTLISGILDDTVYGQGRIPAFTLNIGDAPSLTCSTLDALWQAQRPALLYATADAGSVITETLSRPFGPAASNLAVTSGPAPNTLSVTAVLSANAGTIEGAVYSIDAPGPDGAGTVMSGDFGGSTSHISGTIDLATLPDGRHSIFVQGRNNNNQWGIIASIFFTVTGNLTATATPTGISTYTPTSMPTSTPTASQTRAATFTSTPTGTFTATPTPPAGCNAALYAASGLPTQIPDGGAVTSTLVVSGPGPIADLDLVSLTIQHRSLADLTARLTSPDGTTVSLFANICGFTANMESVALDDGALRTLGEVCPPSPATSYRPAQPLALFNGRPAAGTWTLIVRDTAAGYQGELVSWGLRVNTGTTCLTPTPTSTATTFVTATATATPTRTPTSTRTATGTATPRPPSTATPLPCVVYTDVNPNQFFYIAVNWLTCRHIVSGYADNTFRPYNNATRAQIIKMIVAGEGWPLYSPPAPTFSDVLPADWFYVVVETAYKHGIIGGYGDGTFRPYNGITRGQLSKLIVLARQWTWLDPGVGHFSDVPPGSTFYIYVETAQAHGVVSGYGDGTFRPQLYATRGQLSKMLYTALTEPGL